MRLLKFVTWVILVAALLSPMTVRPGSADIPPNPIDPKKGHATLLDLINSLPLNDIESALDNFPVPYVVIASADGADPTVENHHAGAPTRVNADRSKATGKGGKDIKVEVNTELFPTPHLVLTIDRIGNAPFAEDLEVLIAFPFDAFNDEILPGAPNLFIGYQTTGELDGTEYPPGGHAPSSVEIVFTPDILDAAEHTFELEMNTIGADNPIRFIAGHFDGDATVGILNAIAISAHTDPVPANIAIALDVSSSAILTGGFTDSSVDISWNASEPSKVVFDYLENEDFPFTTPDYNTTLTFDLMPTSEVLSLSLDVAAGTFTLAHTASNIIDEITLLHKREDGLMIVGTASDVPTEVALTLGLSGSVILDVNDNTLDLQLLAIQDGGFPGTDDFFGYDLGYLSIVFEDVPDLEARYVATEDSFTVQAMNPGESIGKMELLIGDDDSLELPPDWEAVPAHHIFSLIDDGTHGTAAARVLHLREATLDLDTAVAESYELATDEAVPLHAYLRTTPTSNVILGHDIEATCDIDVIPVGEIEFDVDFPPPALNFGYTTDPPQGIEEVHCFGHVDTLNFDLFAGDLPPLFEFEFDPDSHLTVKAEDGWGPNSDTVGTLGIRLWDETGPGLPDTSGLLGIPLRDARARVDETPSLQATWADGAAGTSINFDTGIPDAPLFLSGAQVAVSTEVGVLPLPAAAPTSDHYARFIDEGGTGEKQLAAGAFGIDEFTYSSDDSGRSLMLHYSANEDHRLVAHFDSAFGGRFFPNFDIDATLIVDDVPQTFDLTTDMPTEIDYTASDGIDSISLVGVIDDTNDGDPGNGTIVDLLIDGLPSAVALEIDPDQDPDAGLTFTMASPIDSIDLLVTGSEGILGNAIKQIDLNITHIPANWVASWNSAGASVTAVGDAVQVISLIVSTELPDQNATMRWPFTVGGGNVQYTPFAREIDRRWAATGTGATRETDIMSRLDDLYGSTQNLAADEDRVLFRRAADGSFMYLEVQLQDLQGGSFHSADGMLDASLTVPFDDADIHPLYIGLGQPNGEFMTIQVENLPDSMTFDADTVGAGSVNLVMNESPGRLEIYEGPLPSASDGQAATKFILVSAPAEVHIAWDFGFPGGATFDASDPIEIRFLSQNGGSRTVAVVGFEDLELEYGYEVLPGFEGDCIPLTPLCNFYFVIARVFATFTATPGIDGMLLTYDFRTASDGNIDSPPAGVSPNAAEYIPRINLLVENLTEISGEATIWVCVVGLGLPPCIPGVPGADFSFTVNGSTNLDYWDDDDYVDNDPWNFIPLFYLESNRINPFD